MAVRSSRSTMGLWLGSVLLLSAVNGAEAAENPAADEAATKPQFQSLLISGHSLTEMPYPLLVSKILGAQGSAVSVEVQHLFGSSIRQRLQQPALREGVADQKPDALLPSLSAIASSRRFDAMVITEQHRLLDALLWEDTAGSLVQAHAQFISGSPNGKIYFFTPWISIGDRDAIERWVRYEQQAHRAWSCFVAELNKQINAAEQISLLPSALAVAFLAEKLVSPTAPAVFMREPAGTRLARIFRDEVHLTELGSYYVAHLTAWWLTGQLPGERHVSDHDQQDDHRLALRELAHEFAVGYDQGEDVASCTFAQRCAFIAQYVNYTGFYQQAADETTFTTAARQLVRAARFYRQFWNGYARNNP